MGEVPCYVIHADTPSALAVYRSEPPFFAKHVAGLLPPRCRNHWHRAWLKKNLVWSRRAHVEAHWLHAVIHVIASYAAIPSEDTVRVRITKIEHPSE